MEKDVASGVAEERVAMAAVSDNAALQIRQREGNIVPIEVVDDDEMAPVDAALLQAHSIHSKQTGNGHLERDTIVLSSSSESSGGENSSDESDDDTGHLERDTIVLSSSSESTGGENNSDESDDDEVYYSDMEDLDDVEPPEVSLPPKSKSQSSRCLSESLSDKVTRLIGDDHLKNLKADECRSYLRQHGLILSGNKAELIERIDRYYKLKTSNSRNYHCSTFVINCKGDVCKGDVVMFDQKVSKQYDVTTRGPAQKRRRTVAGRIVNESYGALRQQHTFTVEVLWSTDKKLSPMKGLRIKGRKLYKHRIFRQVVHFTFNNRPDQRQRWADEEERKRTIDEKHERGDTARLVRAIRRRKQQAFRSRSFGVRNLRYTGQYAKVQDSSFQSFKVKSRGYTESRSFSIAEQRHHVMPDSARSVFHDRRSSPDSLDQSPPLSPRGCSLLSRVWRARQEIVHGSKCEE